MQHLRGGWLSLVGAVSYGAAFTFFAGTAMYALVRKTSDYATMVGELGSLHMVHGVLMVVGGLLVGVAVVRAGVLPRWTGDCMMGLRCAKGEQRCRAGGPLRENEQRLVFGEALPRGLRLE